MHQRLGGRADEERRVIEEHLFAEKGLAKDDCGRHQTPGGRLIDESRPGVGEVRAESDVRRADRYRIAEGEDARLPCAARATRWSGVS